MSSTPGLLEHRLLLVTGKGGVGKTTVAATLALLAAREGRRCLLCSMEPTGDLELALDCPPLAYAPRETSPGLFAMAMDTEAALGEYLSINFHLPPFGRLGPLAEALDFVATAAPGVREILTVGKLCYEVRERRYDLVVVDATASGHLVGHLAAPVGINELVRVGAIRSQTRWMLDILEDRSRTGVVLVTTPEETPVNEALELAGRLSEETSVGLAAVVANRLLPELFSRSEEEAFERLASDGRAALEAALGPERDGLDGLLEAARVAVRVRRNGAQHLERLLAGLGRDVPCYLLPVLFGRPGGPRAIHLLADALADELGR